MKDSLSRLCILLGTLLFSVLAQQNVVLESTNPDIIYNPPLCSPSAINCTSPWKISNDTIPGTTIVYTDGPIPQAGNVIPQMFLNFRASTLYLRTTSSSNATVNFTLTAEPTDLTITSKVNTSINLIVAVNIPETQTTTLGVTFLPGNLFTRFDVESITLTVANASATSSFLPSPSLPNSSVPPTIITSPTVSTTSNSNASDNKGTIIGSTLGSALGALLLVIGFLVIFRKYCRRRTTMAPQSLSS